MNIAKFSAFLLAISSPLIPFECLAESTENPIVVLCGGDDGLTSRLRDATEQAFNATSDLPLATKERHAVYKVVIPTNVGWKQFGSRSKVLYTVEVLTLDDKKVGAFKGSCWESSIRRCATQIVNETRELLTTVDKPK